MTKNMQKRTFFEKYFSKLAENFVLKHETLKRVCFFIIAQKPVTRLFGPIFTRTPKIAELDLTYVCNMDCVNCIRSCGIAPSSDRMTVEQVKKFIKSNIDNNMKWGKIRAMGGEATLHPDVLEILDLLVEYKRNHAPDTCIEIVTNGYGKKVMSVLSKVPKGVKIANTAKKSRVQDKFFAFNLAPRDLLYYKFADYSVGCRGMNACGLGVTPYGYYVCPMAGGIDRVFGFDIGRKEMPLPGDPMLDQTTVICQYCGRFRGMGGWVKKEIISPSWQEALKKYKTKKPSLTSF